MRKLFFYFVLPLFTLISCSTSNKTTQRRTVTLTKSYLALGDSYTVGEMVETEMSFPYLLVEELKKNDQLFKKPKVVAVTGWRTDELIDSMTYIEGQYDLVSVLIGVNNQYQGTDISKFKKEIVVILENAIRFSKTGEKGVFVYSIPDYSVMPVMRGKDLQKIAAEIKAYNTHLKEACERFNLKFYDITPISQMAKKDTELIADDKLHPSGKMYRMWVEKTAISIRSNHLE